MTVRWNSLECWNGVVSLAVFLVVSHGPVSPCSHPLSPLQLNHFPGSFQIGRKDRLWRNLSRMQSRFGKKEFSFFPQSFILPQDAKLLRKAWESGSRQKWIVKPVSGPGGRQAGPKSGSARVLGQVGKSFPLLSTQPLASVRSRHRHPGHSQVESAPQAEAPSGTEVSPSPAVTPLPASHLLSLGGPLFTMFFCPLSSQPKTFLSPLFKGLYPGNPEKAMAPHSNTLAWKIPWMEEPGRLQSMGSRRVGHG